MWNSKAKLTLISQTHKSGQFIISPLIRILGEIYLCNRGDTHQQNSQFFTSAQLHKQVISSGYLQTSSSYQQSLAEYQCPLSFPAIANFILKNPFIPIQSGLVRFNSRLWRSKVLLARLANRLAITDSTGLFNNLSVISS